ncbi:DM13 domain-containing protein [Endozoicomonas sp. ALC020]|uniref:DM13 domain-containing protein n=1 Tax=unclassified Endozoicomonas TaxID=2644528 RepID=UPI003BB10AB7
MIYPADHTLLRHPLHGGEDVNVTVPSNININSYNTVVVWCETFGEFITAARYR